MGPSGSGKTTLLGAISGRLSQKFGHLKINEKVITDKTIRNISAYIPQQNIFTETLTVLEHMTFMAALKLNKLDNKIIFKLVQQFGLDKNTLINNLSGGEKRKVALISELLCEPYVLFCDEITTGLDSFNAMSVVKKLQDVSNTGKIVILTVHQPSSQLYEIFNNIILMANGKLIFQGTKKEGAQFFEQLNFRCPASYNPSDFYLKCLSDQDIQNNSFLMIFDTIGLNTLKPKEKIKKSILFQLKWLLWRVFIDSKRNFNRQLTSYIILMLSGLLITLSYTNITINSENSVQNIQGAILFIISELIFSHMYYVIFVFPSEVNIYLFEKELYKPLPYFLSKFVSTLPYCFINCFSYVVIYFIFLKFLNGFNYFFQMLSILYLTTVSSTAFGLCLSALFPTVKYIDLFIVPIEVLVMTLSGMWIKIDTVPTIFNLIKYISPFYFTFENLSILQWNTVEIFNECTNTTKLCIRNGQDVLHEFGFHSTNFEVNIIYLHILTILYCLIGYIAMRIKISKYSIY
ncbi:unnamed protein product [Brassicogethes aeneus]|uniref:ABC transporter domain-containing protein n=1 Tax=Brassicogethes aeneus TaxID=1431903 RepID=A0A9P0BFL5_BRAAE|nr:unnamed protein product [Brassicogethes aeneus]